MNSAAGHPLPRALWRATHNDVLFETTRNLAIRLNPYRMFQLRSKGRQEATTKTTRCCSR